jgi:hypothetical protein
VRDLVAVPADVLLVVTGRLVDSYMSKVRNVFSRIIQVTSSSAPQVLDEVTYGTSNFLEGVRSKEVEACQIRVDHFIFVNCQW